MRYRARLLLRTEPAGPAAALLVATMLSHSLAAAWLLGHPVVAGAAAPQTTLSASATGGVPSPPTGGVPSAATGGVPSPPTGGVPSAVPIGLTIPAIGVDARGLVPLGRNRDGSLEVPANYAMAGWFTGGSVPGTLGPAVIVGHVDSLAGPAVFYRLAQLRPGDEVVVRLSDGDRVRFRVDGVRHYPKLGFPTEAVYGPVPGSALRLITCGGSFDRAARSYLDNVVVYASRQ
ncbi:MAG TPA: class F sortase [Pseudonocardia sp.]|nr:class F sortase [Pseudonocardia sp.]